MLRISRHPADSIQQLPDFILKEAIALTGSKFVCINFYDDKKMLQSRLLRARETESVEGPAGGRTHDCNNTLSAIINHAH